MTLTDREPVSDPLHRLRQVYPNIMRLDFAAHGSEEQEDADFSAHEPEKKTPEQLFDDFYVQMHGEQLGDEEKTLVRSLMNEVWQE